MPVSFTFLAYCTRAVRVTGGVTKKRAYENSDFQREEEPRSVCGRGLSWALEFGGCENTSAMRLTGVWMQIVHLSGPIAARSPYTGRFCLDITVQHHSSEFLSQDCSP